MRKGSITRRGKASWRIKFDAGYDASGKRKYYVETIRGTKAEAELLLSKRIVEQGAGQLVERSVLTLADYARHWLEVIAPSKAGRRTLERYGEILGGHIIPHLGAVELQKLDGPQIDTFYRHLATAGRLDRRGGLSPKSIRHIHRLLSQVLNSAVRAGKRGVSPMENVQTVPAVKRPNIRVLDEVELAAVLAYFITHPLYIAVLLAAAVGMRRGEVLALRWSEVSATTIDVCRAVELVGGKMSVKEPKNGCRTVVVPETVAAALAAHRRHQIEVRLRLGIGGKPELVCPTWAGGMFNPDTFSSQFGRAVRAGRVPRVTYHGLRHTHITHLLRAGVPVHVVSQRVGHSSAKQTLDTYAHLLTGQQEDAAAVMDKALRRALD
jgi:integrase